MSIVRALPASAKWGLDTVTISIPVHLGQSDGSSSIFKGMSQRSNGFATQWGERQVRGQTIRIRIIESESRAYLTFEAPRLAGMGYYELLAPGALRVLAESLIKFIPEIVPAFQVVNPMTGEISWERTWAHQTKVHRLDIARQFLIKEEAHARLIRAGIAGVGRRGQVTLVEYPGPPGWSYYRLTDHAGLERIYDKSAKAKKDRQAVPRGLYRFEAEIKRTRLAALGLRTLEDVHWDTAKAALKARWEATGWGTAFVRPVLATSLAPDLTRDEQVAIAAYLATSANNDNSLFTARQQRILRRQAKSHGLKVGKQLDQQGERRIRLDLEHDRPIIWNEP